jgi:ATP-binding cassette subfamily B protein
MTTNKNKDSKTKRFNLKLLWRILAYIKPYRKQFLLSILCVLLLAGLSPIRPWLVQYSIDKVIAIKNFSMLNWVGIAMVLLLLFETIIQFADSYLATWLGQAVIKDIRKQVYNSILSFKLNYFDKNAIGTLVTRTVSDTEAIADIFSQGLLTIMGDILKLSVILLVMFITDWKLTLVSISTIPVLFLATMWFKNAVKKSFSEVRTQVARLNAFVQERINGMSLIQAFNQEKYQLEAFNEINQKHTQANIKSIWHYSVFFPIVEILSSISLGLLVWFGAEQVINNSVQPGHIVAFIIYINMLFRPIRMMADRFNTLQMGMVASERVFKVIDSQLEFEKSGEYIASIKGEIEFNEVWFYYEENHWVLKNINLKIRKGEKIALVGATGSGKTTITALINGFYFPQKGSVTIDGTSINQYNLRALRKQIGIVLQDVFLFSDTVLNNITLCNPEITYNQVIEAAKKLGAHEFINKLPGGYNFNVLERGTTLSAGQKQLISILRAYVHNPAILILDEATANIDSESEQIIQKAISELTYGRTSIIVAHRLSTIQHCDTIYVLNKGEVVEYGSHNQLLDKKGFYSNLIEKYYERIFTD